MAVPPGSASAQLLRNLRLVTYAWGFGAVWMYIATGAALTQYAKLLSMPEYGFGLLAALPYAGTVAQFPASYIIEKFGHRKALFITAGLIHRALWIVIAAIPAVFPEPARWKALLVLLGGSSIASHASNPGVLAMFGELVPSRVRGRYFSRRAQLGQISGLVTATTVGCVLDWAKADSAAALHTSLCAILITAGILGMVDYAILILIRGERVSPPDRSIRFFAMLKVPFADTNFRWFLAFNASFIFGIGFIGQYIWLYAFDVVHLSNTMANLMLMTVPLTVAMVSLPLWGRMIDRYGRRPVLLIAGAFVINGAIAWAFITEDNWWFGYPIAMLAMFGFPGLDLASFNLMFQLTTAPGTRRQNSAYIAANSAVVSLAGILSGAFGGWFAGRFVHWQGSLFGWPLTYHGLLFFISGFFRALSLVFIWRITDRNAMSLTRTLRLISLAAQDRLRRPRRRYSGSSHAISGPRPLDSSETTPSGVIRKRR